MAVRSPRHRVRRLLLVGVVILVAVIAVLLLHVALMPAHHDHAGCATCVVAVVGGITVLVAVAPVRSKVTSIAGNRVSLPCQPLPAISSGRHPPPHGVVLRL